MNSAVNSVDKTWTLSVTAKKLLYRQIGDASKIAHEWVTWHRSLSGAHISHLIRVQLACVASLDKRTTTATSTNTSTILGSKQKTKPLSTFYSFKLSTKQTDNTNVSNKRQRACYEGPALAHVFFLDTESLESLLASKEGCVSEMRHVGCGQLIRRLRRCP